MYAHVSERLDAACRQALERSKQSCVRGDGAARRCIHRNVQQSAFGEDIRPFQRGRGRRRFLSQNQPFLDGNKRTGYLAILTFLTLNGYDIDQTEEERAETFLAMGSAQSIKDSSSTGAATTPSRHSAQVSKGTLTHRDVACLVGLRLLQSHVSVETVRLGQGCRHAAGEG